MRHQNLSRIVADIVLVVGLALSGVGLGAVPAALVEPPTDPGPAVQGLGKIQGSFDAEGLPRPAATSLLRDDPGFRRAASATIPIRPDALPVRIVDASTPGPDGQNRRDQRDFLLDTASSVRGQRFSGMERERTETGLWVSSPVFIGSTSPP